MPISEAGSLMAERTSIRRIVRFPNGSSVNDSIAVEEPLTIRLHGEDLAVLMRTPGDDRALVAGFLLAEGIIQTAADIRALGPCQDASDNPNVVAVELAELAVEDRGHLVDRVGHQEAAVEDRDLGVLFGDILTVDVDDPAHVHPQSSAAGGCTPAAS